MTLKHLIKSNTVDKTVWYRIMRTVKPTNHIKQYTKNCLLSPFHTHTHTHTNTLTHTHTHTCMHTHTHTHTHTHAHTHTHMENKLQYWANFFINYEGSFAAKHLEPRIVHTNISGNWNVVRHSEGHPTVKCSTTSLIFRNKQAPPAATRRVNINFFSTKAAGHKHWKWDRTALEKCTHLYDETQGTTKHKCFRQTVFSGCKKIDRK